MEIMVANKDMRMLARTSEINRRMNVATRPKSIANKMSQSLLMNAGVALWPYRGLRSGSWFPRGIQRNCHNQSSAALVNNSTNNIGMRMRKPVYTTHADYGQWITLFMKWMSHTKEKKKEKTSSLKCWSIFLASPVSDSATVCVTDHFLSKAFCIKFPSHHTTSGWCAQYILLQNQSFA